MLRTLLLRQKTDELNRELDALKAELEKRQAEREALEADIRSKIDNGEDIDAETRAAAEKRADELDAADKAAESREAELRAAIDGNEKQIAELEERQRTGVESAKNNRKAEEKAERSKPMKNIAFKTRALAQMGAEERAELLGVPEIKQFVDKIRGLTANPNTEIIIPMDLMPLMTDTIERYSKLMKHVSLQRFKGKGRVRIFGAVPEGVWTEMGGKINEATVNVSMVELDGYKVAAFVPLDNWVIEDNDIALVDNVIDALGQGIALAVDKAIPFGLGAASHMPTGIVTALLADNNLASHVVNISAANSTGLTLFKKMIAAAAEAKANYSNGELFWTMSEKTYKTLQAEALGVNAAGAIVSGVDKTMPVIGGAVETLSFIPDNLIVGGYGSLYKLLERQAATVKASDQNRFTEDQTLYRATSRYDGKPVIPAGFVAIGIGGTAVATAAATVAFAADTANASDGE